MTPSRSLRTWWTWCAVLLSTAAIAAVAGRWMLHHGLQEENLLAHRQVSLYAQTLSQRIDRYRALPDVLALDAELHAALTQPQSAADVRHINQKLERANGASKASTLTLINSNGIALAASNWRDPQSNVGEDYSFRPYVQQALDHDHGSFYGIGVTTHEAGYFLSRALVDGQRKIIGLVVIKIALQELEREWVQTPDTVFAADAHGVIFLASDPSWRYRLLHPLNATDTRELERTQQYSGQALHPLRYQPQEALREGGAMVQWQDPAIGRKLWQSVPLPEDGWRLHIVHDVSSSESAAWWAAAAAGGTWLALSLLVLYMRQRQRMTAMRQRSREELEALLKQHAQELRSAQDGIVQAAKLADEGLSHGLEHLPQGVVVIDAALNVVAWNSRYMDLFKLPAGLLKVGMPVEALYRHNARRGMLGNGAIDEAIERRMQYLRVGSPHVRESEKADGTVLEIRGNPLPGGGFVTSYADITSYKTAARDLRSLADALEKRIADRTRDLDAAKHEAEQANRYKSKFVAAAVHDLLQPLNAARVFASLLRQQVQDAEALQLARNVEGALSAQDDILNSLLDIARMESGQLVVQLRNFAMQPLLDTLGNQLGVLAASNGLTLKVVPCHYRVCSDEALLRRILQNFLSNAIRYTRQGRVVIGCRRAGNQLRIEVHDQGPGIPEGLHQEIFEEFRRLETGRQHERGAGLGLAIVDRLGKLLHHPIGLRSKLGQGTVFWVYVPLANAEAADSATQSNTENPAPITMQHDASAWYVGPSSHAGQQVCQLLQRWGYPLQMLDNLEVGTDTAKPRLLVVDGDNAQPDLVAQQLAQWRKTPSVIWLTQDLAGPHSQQAQRRGWSVLAHPVKPAALRALVNQLALRHS
ncbi:MAG: PAS-domain containing protein [Comamonas sp.]